MPSKLLKNEKIANIFDKRFIVIQKDNTTCRDEFLEELSLFSCYRSSTRKKVLSDIQTTARGGLKNETLSTRKSVHLIKFCDVWRLYEEERL